MPNWCETKVAFVTTEENLEKLEAFREKLINIDEKWKRLNASEYSVCWLIDVATEYEVEKQLTSVNSTKGYLINIGEIRKDVHDKNYLFIVEEIDAWEGNRETWEIILKEETNGSDEFYILTREYEPGMGIYRTNDVEGEIFVEKYYVDISGVDVSMLKDLDDTEDAEFEVSSKEEVLEILNRYIECDKTFNDPRQFVNYFNDYSAKNEDKWKGYIYMHTIDIVN